MVRRGKLPELRQAQLWSFRSEIITNKGFEEWTEFLNDAALATAILDRLSYRCDRIQMSGKSYRLENRKSFLREKGTEQNEIS